MLAGGINGTNLSPGTQNATVSIYGRRTGTGQPVQTSIASAVIDPVYSRVIDSVSAASFGRVMQGNVAGASITVSSTGSHDSYSDLTMNAGTVMSTTPSGTFSGTNNTPVLFNGTTTTSPAVAVSATFSNTISGPVSGSVTLPGNQGLFTGETLASGTPTPPSLVVPYTATVIQPRQLAPATGSAANPVVVPTTGGGLLYGANVPVLSYSVSSTNTNPDSNHTSLVYVGGSSPQGQTVTSYSTANGTTPVGQVSVAQTLVDGSTPTQNVALSIGAYSYGPISGSAAVNVATAEAIQDNTNYAPVGVTYKISNVGYAATGGADPANPNNQLFGAALSAPIQAGAMIAPTAANTYLSSVVAAAGTSGSNSTATALTDTTLAAQSTVNRSNVHGTVGSECDLVQSTVLASSTTVTMQWRNRNNAENGSGGVNGSGQSWSDILPSGIQWLDSDVVEIGGIPGNGAVNVAMQMSYDERITQVFDGSNAPVRVQGLYLAKLVNGKWVNATSDDVSDNLMTGIHAQIAVSDSLSDFLYNEEIVNGYTLDELVGSWGVNTTNDESWAIVNNGGGTFAVVPEPSSLAILAMTAGGLLFWRWRYTRPYAPRGNALERRSASRHGRGAA